MHALPFPCIRPVDAAGLACPASAEKLDALLDAGAYLRDSSPSYFVCRGGGADGAFTALLAVCPLPLDAPLGDGGEGARPSPGAARILELGCQSEPVALSYPREPVLDMILGAATIGAPLFNLERADGAALAVWEIKREDSRDAIRAMLERIEGAEPVDASDWNAAVEAGSEMRRRAERDDPTAAEIASRLPFSWTLCALAPDGEAARARDLLPAGLILHQVAKP